MNTKSFGALILVLILFGGGYWFYHANHKSSQIEQVTISQAYQVFLYAPLYIAQEKGFFAQQGLHVNIVTAGGDDKAFASLVSGSAQFAVGDPTFAAIAGEKGQPGIIVGALLNGVPFWGVAKNLNIPPIATPAALGNYKVATFPAPSTAYALQVKMFNTAGLKPNILQGAPGSLVPAVQNGNADIALELEPNVSTAVKNGFHIVYSLSEYYPNFAVTGITVLPSFAKQNPTTVQKLLNAIQESDSYIRSNPQDAAALLAKDFPDVSMDVAVSALNNIIKANVIPSSLVTSETAWNGAILLRKDTGDLKKDAPYTTYVDNNFAEKAK